MEKKFIFLDHTADIKFRAFGETLNEVFENAARAMFAAMHTGRIIPTIKKTIHTKGDDLPAILYNFLEELIFLMDTQDFFLSNAKVKITKERSYTLKADIEGAKASEQEISIVVKAVTYHEMFVKEEKQKKRGERKEEKNLKWTAQVVVDV